MQNLTINEGTISFWIKEGSLVFNDFKPTILFSIKPAGGIISMIKDSDNKIKVIFEVINKSRTDLEFDVTNLIQKQKNNFILTWNIGSKELILYLNGKSVKKETISI